MPTKRPTPAQSVSVYLAEDCWASDGANMGDTLSFADELILDDYYTIKASATPKRLAILPHDDGHFPSQRTPVSERRGLPFISTAR